jgi:hypothetical protein
MRSMTRGTYGVQWSRFMPAACGVRFALRPLHVLHAATQLSHEFAPPSDLGLRWSTVVA